MAENHESIVTIRGVIERITFTNPANGYTVARFKPDRQFELITVVGALAEVHPGARLRLEGRWKNHPKYGDQFELLRYTEERPATIEGIRRYLGSGLIKGIGPKTAGWIVNYFGTKTLDVIEHDIQRLTEVRGIAGKTVAKIAAAWEAQKQIKEIMLFLQSHKVSTTLAVKIYKQYGDESIEVVQATPYRLAQDIFGIGFVTADQIARNIGLAADDPARVAAGIEYTLNQLADQGHVYAPREQLVAAATKILAVEPALIETQLDALVQAERLKTETLPGVVSAENPAAPGEAIYLAPFYYAELGVTNRLKQLQAAADSRLRLFQTVDWERAFAWLAGRPDGLDLAERQRQAVQMSLSHKVSILTGGPGTGKTSTVRAILGLLGGKGKTALLAAPTGRAAKRLAESTGQEAKTIHRLLEVSPSEGFKFQRNQDNPLDCDLLIVDECSMIDLVLMNNLLKAIHPASHLLLVGDADQLPSVGAGNVLRDLIASDALPVTRLEVIFRQAADSTIITNAHRINRGEMPLFPRHKQDFFFFGQAEPAEAAEMLVDVVARRIPEKFGLPAAGIQVLSPMHRGLVGARALNEKLQARLNPLPANGVEYRSGSRVFRPGDRVLQLRNNYDKEVFNGDIGTITRLDLEEGEISVDFEGRGVDYDFSDLDELTLAYALSVHKSQGSEYPVVVLPLLPQHYMLLQRNLLYTAVTRAKQMVVIVGSRKALAMAVKNNTIAGRWSLLDERLRGGV
ncbi:MAG: ATP-dependent RecD-like DNA helicase [Anaerolineae bacterium]|nr:ATP-dependent RecD-like DNA helicase [Anaerolineae bacterium]